ncbi:MAG: hypothetical protein K8H88_10350, partial [Sandaracinaceae bacterium]|nr:hypothetical protein [Sandaracinaceae bacterium]
MHTARGREEDQRQDCTHWVNLESQYCTCVASRLWSMQASLSRSQYDTQTGSGPTRQPASTSTKEIHNFRTERGYAARGAHATLIVGKPARPAGGPPELGRSRLRARAEQLLGASERLLRAGQVQHVSVRNRGPG